MSVFVDTSIWFAAALPRDRNNVTARGILASIVGPITTDHVMVETYALLHSRYSRVAAEDFWRRLRASPTTIELVTTVDLEVAWAIGQAFDDQDFSMVDRTSFAVMERLGVEQVASLDHHFAVYRYGRNRERTFNIVRSGHSENFRLFHRAILDRKQIVCNYQGKQREVCPIILGHKDGAEKALVYQFAGESSRGLSRRGDWKCFELAKVSDTAMRDGPWHAGDSHKSAQRCVDDVYIDVNLAVPNQPGRRGR